MVKKPKVPSSPSQNLYKAETTCKMMQDYSVGIATAPVGMLAAGVVAGKLHIFNATPDGHLVRLRRDSESPTGWVQDRLHSSQPELARCNAVWACEDRGALCLVVGVPGFPMTGEPRGLFTAWVNDDGLMGGTASGWSPVSGMGSFFPGYPPSFLTVSDDGNGGRAISGYRRPGEPLIACAAGNERISMEPGDKFRGVPFVWNGPDCSFVLGRGSLDYFQGTVAPNPEPYWKLLCEEQPIGDPNWIVNDFVVVGSQNSDSPQVIAAVGNTICSLKGSPAGGRIDWPRSWTVHAVAGTEGLTFAEIKARVRQDRSVELTVKDNTGRLLRIIQTDPLNWVAVPITKGPVGQWLAVEEANQNGFVFVDADGRLNLYLRGGEGDYRAEAIEIEGDSAIAMATTYRAGITIMRPDNAAVSGLNVTVAASSVVRVTINGAPYLIGPGHSVTVPTDGAGNIWVTTAVTSSLYAPVYTFTSPLLEGYQLEIRPDAAAHDFLAWVTPADLVAGKIAKNDQDASQIVDALKEVLALSAQAYRPMASGPSDKVSVAAGRGVRVRPLQPSPAADVLYKEHMPDRSWRFGVESGRPVFQPLTASAAREILAERRAVGRRQADWNPFSKDDWEDTFSSLEQELVSVADIVATTVAAGVEAAVTFVVNGVPFVLDAVIDSVAKVFDLVNSIFDAVGVTVGAVVGWVLDRIGFLFGWDEIKQQRDAFKTMALAAMRNAPRSMPSPKASVGTYITFLEDARRDMDRWIAQARSSPVSSQQFAQTTYRAPSLPDLFRNARGLPALPQATWITDKLQEALRAFSAGLPFPAVPGLDEALSRFEAAMARVASAFDLDSEAQAAIDSWISDSNSFSRGSLDPLLAFIQVAAGRTLDAMREVAEAGAGLLQLFWDNPQMLFDWLDSPVRAPFFSAFYKSVLKNNFSALDVVCLAAGISAVATGRKISPPASDEAGDDDTRLGIILLMGIGCFTTGMAAFASAQSSGTPSPPVRFLIFLDCTVAAIVGCAAAARGGGSPGVQWTQAGVSVTTALYATKGVSSHPILGNALVQNILNLVQSIIDGGNDMNEIAYCTFESVQNLGYMVAIEGGMPPPRAAAFGGFQAAMSALMTYFWTQDNPSRATPDGASLTGTEAA